MFRISWRLQRRGLIGMSGFGVFYGLVQAAAYNSAAGSTPAARAAFGHQMELFGRQFSSLLPLPIRVDTMSGYVQWRVYGALPLLFGFWALMSAAGATRGDEERGLVEMWLASVVGASRYIAVRFLAFIVAALIAVALTSAAIDFGAIQSGSPLEFGALTEISAALLAVTVACYGIAMALSQLVETRTAAAGLAGAVLVTMYFSNSFSRTLDSLQPAARIISPFYHYDRSNPLSPGGTFDFTSTVGLVLVGVVTAALAAWLMTIRDIGSPLLRRHPRQHRVMHRPSPNPVLRIPVLSALYEHRVGLLVWTLGAAFLAAYFASVSRPVVDLVKGPGAGGFRAYLALVGHGNPYVAIAGFFWFGIFQLLLAVYAITQVARWSSDDNEGRLEMQLSAPVSRWRVVGERAAALVLSTCLIVAVSSAAFDVALAAANIDVGIGEIAVAAIALVPFALSFAGIGAVMATRVPRAAISVLSAFAFASYLLTEAGPLMRWPDWILKLSVFSLYGTPLTSGVYWTGLWALLAVTMAGFGLAAVLMQRREVGR